MITCSIIVNENQKMHKLYIFSQFIAPACFGRAWPSSGCAVTGQVIQWYVQGVIVHKYILHSPNIMCYVDNLKIKSCVCMFKMSCVPACALCGGRVGNAHIVVLAYLLCNSAPWWWSNTTETCRCYKLRKYNLYDLCILLVFISNYSTMHRVEHIKYVVKFHR